MHWRGELRTPRKRSLTQILDKMASHRHGGPFLRQYPRTEPRKTVQRRAFEGKQTPDLTPGGVTRPPRFRPRPALRGGVQGPGGPCDPRPLSCAKIVPRPGAGGGLRHTALTGRVRAEQGGIYLLVMGSRGTGRTRGGQPGKQRRAAPHGERPSASMIAGMDFLYLGSAPSGKKPNCRTMRRSTLS